MAAMMSQRVRKKIPCRRCGHPLTRTTVLRQDQTPGDPRTVEQICAELRAQADAWVPENDLCGPCEAFPDAPFVPYDPNRNVRI